MDTRNQDIFDAALALPHTERFALAELLYSSVADEAESLNDEQLAIIESRVQDVEVRGEKTLAIDEVTDYLRKKGTLWS